MSNLDRMLLALALVCLGSVVFASALASTRPVQLRSVTFVALWWVLLVAVLAIWVTVVSSS